MGNTERAHKLSPKSGRGLSHVTPKIFGIRSNISRKLLELQTSNLVCSFVPGMPSRRTNNFPESGRRLGHVTPTIFGIRSYISLKLLELEKLRDFKFDTRLCMGNAEQAHK